MPLITSLSFADGAEFRFRVTEMDTLDRAAYEMYGGPVSQLKIGKAAVLLFEGYMQTIYNGAVEVNGIVIDSDLDGVAATKNAIDKAVYDKLNDQMRIAVTETGRLAVSVYADYTINPDISAPTAYFEVLSDARKQVTS